MDFKAFIRGIKRLVISVIKNDFYGMASEMGFMLVLGIFPFMLFLTAIFGWLGHKDLITPVLGFLSTIIPKQVMDLVMSVLSEAMIFSHGKLIAIIGFCVTIILSTNAIAVVLKGLNKAYKVEDTRSFLYTRTLAFLMFIVDTLVLFLSIKDRKSVV